MAKINANLMSIAKQIAHELNKKDGDANDNKISKEHWDAFALSKGAKDNVNEFMSVRRAELSIYTYLKKNANKNETADDLGAKWLNEVSASIEDIKSDDEIYAITEDPETQNLNGNFGYAEERGLNLVNGTDEQAENVSLNEDAQINQKSDFSIDNSQSDVDTQMPTKENEVGLDELSGIDRIIAEKANVNGGNTLDLVEMRLFTEIKSTYNSKNETFIVDGVLYNKDGSNCEVPPQIVEEPVSTFIYRLQMPEDIQEELRNTVALNKIKSLVEESDEMRNKTIAIEKTVNDKNVKFSYNQASIEDYIINDAVDKRGNKNKHFADIPTIRQKPYALRTADENKKLIEFDNMVNAAISAGVEYGLDPKVLIATMQIEVGFAGLGDKVTGVNGKGYMQITSNPIRDMLGYDPSKKGYGKLKTNVYGPEFVELLQSRGFDVDCPSNQRGKIVSDIVKYLIKNTDADFNIRLGAIIYRRNFNGNVRKASEKYNGHPNLALRHEYGSKAAQYYSRLVEKEERIRTA